MNGIARLILLAAPLALLGGCGESPSAPETAPPDAEILAGLFGMAGADHRSGTLPCPAGGDRSVTFESTLTEGDGEIIAEIRSTVRHNACAMRAGRATLVTDGEIVFEGFERRVLEEGRVGSILERHSRQTGSLRWHGDGHDRTCDIDVTETFDPQSGVRSFSGTICGNPVSFTHPVRWT